jgi:16S rRNA (cytosine1402-N4)-methyltransferase
VSSPQLDEAERGFSFMRDGELDMRMDTTRGSSAAQFIATANEETIADVLYRLGEELFSRRIARFIVEARAQQPITRTLQLAEIISRGNPKWEKNKHPATRSFLALRLHVNNELGDLDSVLPQAVDVLAPGGRLSVISFHSLEDRIVKLFMRREAKGDDLPKDLPIRYHEVKHRLKVIGKPIMPPLSEVSDNVRARSAVLRIAEKVGSGS